MLIAHITDTHITVPGTLLMGIVDTASVLERAVETVNRLDPSPDVAVLTGDLVETGAPEEYAYLRALLAPLRMPVFAIPGNHDAREPMRETFIGDGYLPRQGFLNYAVENYPLRIVALDTLVPGEGGGALCADRLRWLERILSAAPDRPSASLTTARPTQRARASGWFEPGLASHRWSIASCHARSSGNALPCDRHRRGSRGS